jgi:hypothetical protein
MVAVAEAISLTPSAVSQQLAALERAKLLAKRAEPILGALREAAEEVAAHDGDATGELRLATLPSVAAALCFTVLRAFGERHPRHRIRQSEMGTAASISAVGTVLDLLRTTAAVARTTAHRSTPTTICTGHVRSVVPVLERPLIGMTRHVGHDSGAPGPAVDVCTQSRRRRHAQPPRYPSTEPTA